jgi:L-rhamnose mutarotase
MTVESEMLSILKKYGISRLSAFLEGDGIKVRVYGNRTFDQRAYYQRNRERIRKYQSRYYRLHREEIKDRMRNYWKNRAAVEAFKPVEDNNMVTGSIIETGEAVQEPVSIEPADFSFIAPEKVTDSAEAVQERENVPYDVDSSFFHSGVSESKPIDHMVERSSSVITHEQLAYAMANLLSTQGRKADPEEFLETAEGVMQFFGFEREVVGNHLEPDETALMYQLEDIGLIDTRIEEYKLPHGNPWRVNYFVLNVGKIREYSSRSVESDEASSVYGSLPEEAWVR